MIIKITYLSAFFKNTLRIETFSPIPHVNRIVCDVANRGCFKLHFWDKFWYTAILKRTFCMNKICVWFVKLKTPDRHVNNIKNLKPHRGVLETSLCFSLSIYVVELNWGWRPFLWEHKSIYSVSLYLFCDTVYAVVV